MPRRASPACSPARKFSVVHLLVHSLSMMRSRGGVARVLRSRDHRERVVAAYARPHDSNKDRECWVNTKFHVLQQPIMLRRPKVHCAVRDVALTCNK